MGRTETAKSKDLERSMNMQVRMLTFAEHLQHMEMIDNLDDERRKEYQGSIIWHNSMQRSFFKRSREAINQINEPISKDIFSIVKEFIVILNEWETFHHDFHSKIKNNQDQEKIYEQHEDDTRRFLIAYSEQCKERLSKENRDIEEKLILENVLKSMSKK